MDALETGFQYTRPTLISLNPGPGNKSSLRDRGFLFSWERNILNARPYQVNRALTDDEREGLKQSLAEDGQLYPILRDDMDNVIDGHTREELLLELGKEPEYKTLHGLSEQDKLRIAYTVNMEGKGRQLSREEIIAIRRAMRHEGFTYQAIAEATATSEPTARRQTHDVSIRQVTETQPKVSSRGRVGEGRPVGSSNKPKEETVEVVEPIAEETPEVADEETNEVVERTPRRNPWANRIELTSNLRALAAEIRVRYNVSQINELIEYLKEKRI
jgi:hypothetical protein